MTSLAFDRTSTAEAVTADLDLTGRTYLLTGCNSGLGFETARVLGLRGARVIGLARTEAKATAALAELGVSGVGVACDLSDLDSVRAAVRRVGSLGPLDGIIANAGIMALPTLSLLHGVERQLFVNHVGHFALVTGILHLLTADGRVVVLSSGAHYYAKQGAELDNASGERDYDAWRMYGRSKLANILFAKSLARRLRPGQTANAVHPGVIRTNLARHVPDADALFAGMAKRLKTVGQGAATQVLVATHPALASVTGAYFADCAPARTLAHAEDEAQGEALWTWTEALLARL